MTVEKLITELQKYPSNMVVDINAHQGFFPHISNVHIQKVWDMSENSEQPIEHIIIEAK